MPTPNKRKRSSNLRGKCLLYWCMILRVIWPSSNELKLPTLDCIISTHSKTLKSTNVLRNCLFLTILITIQTWTEQTEQNRIKYKKEDCETLGKKMQHFSLPHHHLCVYMSEKNQEFCVLTVPPPRIIN